MEETATYKIDFSPRGFDAKRIDNTAADWVNLILERLHPWAAVRFIGITKQSIWFESGPRVYVLRFEPFSVHEFDGDGELQTTASIRVRQELTGWKRDDDGNRVPPNGSPGDWKTLCRNADAAAIERPAARQPAAAPLPQTLGGFRPMDELPPDKRVLFQVENRPPMVGWYDSRDQSYQAVTEYNGRLDLAVGVRPIGWLPIE